MKSILGPLYFQKLPSIRRRSNMEPDKGPLMDYGPPRPPQANLAPNLSAKQDHSKSQPYIFAPNSKSNHHPKHELNSQCFRLAQRTWILYDTGLVGAIIQSIHRILSTPSMRLLSVISAVAHRMTWNKRRTEIYPK